MYGEAMKERFQMGNIVLELVDFLEFGKIFVEGNMMIRYAMELGAVLDQSYIGIVLNNPIKIPASYDEYDLVFAGARLKVKIMACKHDEAANCGCDYYEFVAYLRKIRGIWRLGYGNIACDWDLRCRLLRRRYDLAA